jgi:hypothetical protein
MFENESLNKKACEQKETKKVINNLIPALIQKSENFTKAMKKRIKARSILSEFDCIANQQFNNYIKESDKRYRFVKSGIALDSAIQSSGTSQNNLANQILNDELFIKGDFSEEKENMKQKSTNNIYKEVNSIIKKVKDFTLHSNTASMPNIKSYINKQPLNNNKINNDNQLSGFFSPNESRFKDNKNNDNKLRKINFNNNINISPNISRFKLKENEKIIKWYMDNDKKLFDQRLKSYKDSLNELKYDTSPLNTRKFQEDVKSLKINNNLKMLEYTQLQKDKKHVSSRINKNAKKIIDLHKLLYFSRKFGKKRNKSYDEEFETLENITSRKGTVNNTKYNDTLTLVKNTANNGLFIEEMFQNKYNKIHNLLYQKEELPILDEYEKIIKSRVHQQNTIRRRTIRKNTINMSDALLEPEEKIRKILREKKEKFSSKNNIFITGSKI